MEDTRRLFAHELLGLALREESFRDITHIAPIATKTGHPAKTGGKQSAKSINVTVSVSQTGVMSIPVRWDCAGNVTTIWKPDEGMPSLFVAKWFCPSKDALAALRFSWKYSSVAIAVHDGTQKHATLHACLAVVTDDDVGSSSNPKGFALQYRAQDSAPARDAVPGTVMVEVARIYCMGHEAVPTEKHDPLKFSASTSQPFFPQLLHHLQLGPLQYDEDSLLLVWDNADHSLLMGSMAEAPHTCRATLRQQVGASRLRGLLAPEQSEPCSLMLSFSWWERRLDKNAGLVFLSKRVKTTALEQCQTLRPTLPAQSPLDASMARFGCTAEETSGLLGQLLARKDPRALPVDMARKLGLSECSNDGIAAIMQAVQCAPAAPDSGAPLHLPSGGAPCMRTLIALACQLEVEQRNQRDHSIVVRYSHFTGGGLRTLIASRFDRSHSNTAAFLREYASHHSLDAWSSHNTMAKLGEGVDQHNSAGSIYLRACVPFSFSLAVAVQSTGDAWQCSGCVFVRAEDSVSGLRAALCAKLRTKLAIQPKQGFELAALTARGLQHLKAPSAAAPPPPISLKNMTPIEKLEIELLARSSLALPAHETDFVDGVYVVTNGRQHFRADPNEHLMLTWWFLDTGGDTLAKKTVPAPTSALLGVVEALNNQDMGANLPEKDLDPRIRSITWVHNDTLHCKRTPSAPGADMCSVVQNSELKPPYCVSFDVTLAWLLRRLHAKELQFRRPITGWCVEGSVEIYQLPGPAAAADDVPAAVSLAEAEPLAAPPPATKFGSLVAAMMATCNTSTEPDAADVAEFVARRVLDVVFANARGNAVAHEQQCRRVNLFLWQDMHLASTAAALLSVLRHAEPPATADPATATPAAPDAAYATLPLGLAMLLFKYWEREDSTSVVVFRDARASDKPLRELVHYRTRPGTHAVEVRQIWMHLDGKFSVETVSMDVSSTALCAALDTLTSKMSKEPHGVVCVFNEKQRLARKPIAKHDGAAECLEQYARFAELDTDRYTPRKQDIAHRRATASKFATWLCAVQGCLEQSLSPQACAGILAQYHVAHAVQQLRTHAVDSAREFNTDTPAEYWKARHWRTETASTFWSTDRIKKANAILVPAGLACSAGVHCRSNSLGGVGLCCDEHLAEPQLDRPDMLATYPGLLGALRMHAAMHDDVRGVEPGGCLQNASLLAYCASRQHHTRARGLHALRAALYETARCLALNVYLYMGADPMRQEYNSETAGPLPCPAGMLLGAPGDNSAAHNVLLRVDAQDHTFMLLTWDPFAALADQDAQRVRFLRATREIYLDAGFCAVFQGAVAQVRTILPAAQMRAKRALTPQPTSHVKNGEWLCAHVWHLRVWQRAMVCPKQADVLFVLQIAGESKTVDFYHALTGEDPAARAVGALYRAPGYQQRLYIARSSVEDGNDLCWKVTASLANSVQAPPASSCAVPTGTESMAFVCAHANASVPHALAMYAQRAFAVGMTVFQMRPLPALGIQSMCRVLALREGGAHGAGCTCMDLIDGTGLHSKACRFSRDIARIPSELCFRDRGNACMPSQARCVSTADLSAIMLMQLTVSEAVRLIRLYQEMLHPAKTSHDSVYLLPDGLLLVQNDKRRAWVTTAAAPCAPASLPSLLAGESPMLLSAMPESVSSVSPFELMALLVLQRNHMHLQVENDLMLVARDAILLRLHTRQPLWNTSFLCAECNREVTRSRADNSIPGAAGAVCFSCAKQAIHAACKKD